MALSSENMAVLVNIIGGVESGGQVYGNRRYNAYTAPYTNTSKEHTITLGWAQNYGSEAYKLILMIYTADPAGFEKIDNSNVIKPMIDGSHDWVAERWNPSKFQKSTLINLIDSEVGHKCQDELFSELMKTFVKSCEETYTSDVYAVMMYCEIRHLGGKSAADRIFKRCGGDYSLTAIMNALKADQSDKSSSNQVGDAKFWSRHECCYKWVKEYATNTPAAEPKQEDKSKMTKEKAVALVLSTARAEEGYLEKASNKNLTSKTANAGYGNYTKYWTDIKPSYQGSQWCLVWTHWVYWKAFGKAVALKLLRETSSQFPLTYCPDMGNVGTKNKALYTKPEPADIVLFWKKREDGYRFGHAGIVISATSTTVTTIEGNTSAGSSVVPNGGGVYIKTYKLSDLHSKTRYYRPDWSAIEGVEVADSTKENTYSTETKLNENQQWIGEVTTLLNVRTGPGKEYSVSKYYPQLAEGDRIGVCDTVTNARGEKWYYIIITNDVLKAKGKAYIHDFVRADFIRRV